MPRISLEGDALELFKPGKLSKAVARAMRKASSSSLRDMGSEASKRVRARKRLKIKAVKRAMVLRKNTGRDIGGMEWSVGMRADKTRLSDYPHRQLKKGVKVQVNRGQRTFIRSAFVAKMRTGHKGIFLRRGAKRLPIFAPAASRPVDALLHAGESEGVIERGRASFSKNFSRLFDLELDKLGGR